MLASFVGTVQGGTITSGSIFFGGQTASASLSGSNFQADIADQDVGPFSHGGFPAFTQPIPNGTWGVGFGSSGSGSGVTYNGVFYPSLTLFAPPGLPYASPLDFA